MIRWCVLSVCVCLCELSFAQFDPAAAAYRAAKRVSNTGAVEIPDNSPVLDCETMQAGQSGYMPWVFVVDQIIDKDTAVIRLKKGFRLVLDGCETKTMAEEQEIVITDRVTAVEPMKLPTANGFVQLAAVRMLTREQAIRQTEADRREAEFLHLRLRDGTPIRLKPIRYTGAGIAEFRNLEDKPENRKLSSFDKQSIQRINAIFKQQKRR